MKLREPITIIILIGFLAFGVAAVVAESTKAPANVEELEQQKRKESERNLDRH